MKIAIFGGSFDPVHSEHVRCAVAAKEALGLDKLIVVPTGIAPHKQWGASASGEDRLAMCCIAFRGLDWAEVSDAEVRAQGASYTYLTCRRFAAQYPDAERYFLVGEDMLEDFFTWREPDDILSHVTLAACGRGHSAPERLHERFRERFGKDFLCIPFTGEEVSSRMLRVDLAFGKQSEKLDGGVRDYILSHGLYTHPAIAPALALEKEPRREHSYRVARMAVARASSAGVEEGKALLAAALHDCGKYVPSDSPLLKGFAAPDGVPAPVLHQYTGAYLAEHLFHVEEEDVLDAIRYHTSGRRGMTKLGILIYLADMLEEGRTFPGVEELRDWFYKDLNACLYHALRQQDAYLKGEGKPIYPLTDEAYRWIAEVVKQEYSKFA